MGNATNVGRVSELARGIVNDPIEKLVQNPDWGSINFQEARPQLELIFNIANHLLTLPIDLVPDTPLAQFSNSLEPVSNTIESIRSFNLSVGSPIAQRDSLINQLFGHADNLLITVQGWIPFLAYQKGDIQENIKALNSTVGTAKQILENADRDAKKATLDLDGIIKAAREASATVGVAHFTADFSGQADTNETDAKSWLKATGWVAGVTCATAIGSFFIPLKSDASTAVVLQFMTSKLVLLGMLIGATAWCARTYRALKHQAATNRHRSNALKSFQAFVKATDDTATRNAVLLETTRSIFAIAPSGYLESGDSSADTGSKVLEIVKSATNGGGEK